jgi:protein-S-isoprenylcysteine O-methyltransferase Ste14
MAAGRQSAIPPIVGTIVFLFVAPGIMGVLIPLGLSGWTMQPPFLGFEPFRWLGVLLLVLGAVILLDSFARFALEGRGTPAPIYPTATLVVSGAYRHVRNPMYFAVAALVIGQSFLFGSAPVLWYAVIFVGVTHLFVIAYEEPTLQQTYGDQYSRYRANVRRWIPRLTPWRG